MDQLIYAEHPYLQTNFSTPEAWDAAFGNFANQHPLMISEFNVLPAFNNDTCFSYEPKVASQLLEYLYRKHYNAGMSLWTYNYPDTLFNYSGPPAKMKSWLSQSSNLTVTNLTTFNGDSTTCGRDDTGAAGLLVYNYFQAIHKLIPSPTGLEVQQSPDGLSLRASWKGNGSDSYLAAALPRGPPLFSPPEGAFPPPGAVDLQSKTSKVFSNLAPGTYMVEVWAYNAKHPGLYSPPAVLSNMGVNGEAQ